MCHSHGYSSLPLAPDLTLVLLSWISDLLAAFGLSLFANSSNQARLDLLVKGLPGLVAMLLELAPTLGDYYGVKKELKQQRAADLAADSAAVAVPVAAAAVSSSNGNGASS